MQTIASMCCPVIKCTGAALVIVVLLCDCFSFRAGKSELAALKFSDKIQYFDISDNRLKTMQDSMIVYYTDDSVLLYEKFEELTETILKYRKGANGIDTAFFEVTPTGKIKKYYFAFFKNSQQGYFFDNLNDISKYKKGNVDSVNKTSVGLNKFPVDSIMSYPNIKLVKKMTDQREKTMELQYAFTDGGDDGDSAFLRFSKTTTSLFSISPKLDKAYGMNLSSFVIVTNERFNKQINYLIPRREFAIKRENVNQVALKENINSFIKDFKKTFKYLNN